jgi:hypothetical protein
VLEIAAREILPALVTEVSAQAIRHAARSATESAVRRQAPLQPAPAAALDPVHSTTIVSEMPGRVRLQMAGLRGNQAHAAALKARLLTLPGVSRVEASALTGKALVEYDPNRVSLPDILALAAVESPAHSPIRCGARTARTDSLALAGT